MAERGESPPGGSGPPPPHHASPHSYSPHPPALQRHSLPPVYFPAPYYHHHPSTPPAPAPAPAAGYYPPQSYAQNDAMAAAAAAAAAYNHYMALAAAGGAPGHQAASSYQTATPGSPYAARHNRSPSPARGGRSRQNGTSKRRAAGTSADSSNAKSDRGWEAVVKKAESDLANVQKPRQLLDTWLNEVEKTESSILRDVLWVSDGLVEGLMEKLETVDDRERLWACFCFGETPHTVHTKAARRLQWEMTESHVQLFDRPDFRTEVAKLHADIRRVNLLAEVPAEVAQGSRQRFMAIARASWYAVVAAAERHVTDAATRLRVQKATAEDGHRDGWYETAASLASVVLAEVTEVLKAFEAALELVLSVEEFDGRASESSIKIADATTLLTQAAADIEAHANGTTLPKAEPAESEKKSRSASRGVQRVIRFNETRPTRAESQSSSTAASAELASASKPRRRHQRMKSSPDELLNLQLSSVADTSNPKSRRLSDRSCDTSSTDRSSREGGPGAGLDTSIVSTTDLHSSEEEVADTSTTDPNSGLSPCGPSNSPAHQPASGRLPPAPRKKSSLASKGDSRVSFQENLGRSLSANAPDPNTCAEAASAVASMTHGRSRSLEDIFRVPDGVDN